MAQIVIESGIDRGRRYTLPTNGTISIGRDEKCAIRLEDPMSSRVHCVLRFQDGNWVLEDTGSLNRTFVNDAEVDVRVLAGGDTIQVGETLLSFVVEDVDPLVGKTIGGYHLEARIGRGATGTVYLAQQLSLDRPVAMKILARRFADDRAFVSRFLDEARAVARLNHAHVVQVFDAGNDGGHYYISMEYLEGGSLEDVLVRDGPLEVEEAIRVGCEAARALAFAEQHEIVHRDIKPANLLLTANGTVKLGDLGIATDLKTAATQGLGRIAGSPRYMAPEQARGDPIDHRADIYALGTTLYCALAGEPPFDGATFREIVEAKLENDPPQLWRRVPGVPLSLSEVVLKMMARNVEARYASARDVETALMRTLKKGAVRRRARVRRARGAPRRGAAAAPLKPTGPAARPAGGRSAGAASERPSPRRASAPRVVAPRYRRHSVPVAPFVAAALCVLLLTGGLFFLSWMDGRDREAPETTGSAEQPNPPGGAPPPTLTTDLPRDRRTTDAAALDEVESVRREWSDGKMGAAEARDRLRDLAVRHGAIPALTEAIEQALAAVDEREEEGARTRAEDLGKQIETLFEEGNLARVASVLAQFTDEYPGYTTLMEEHHGRLNKEASRIVTELQSDVTKLLQSGDTAAATGRVEALRPQLGDAGAVELDRMEKEIADAREMLDRGVRAVKGSAEEVRQLIGRLDFDRAAQVLKEVTGSDVALQEAARPVRSELLAARAVWEQLQRALEEAASRRATLFLKIEPSPSESLLGRADAETGVEGKFRVTALEGAVVHLQPSLSKDDPISTKVLALSSESLSDLLGEAPADDASGEVTIDRGLGLGLLLLLRRGPDRAGSFLVDSTATSQSGHLAARRALLREFSANWLSVRTDELENIVGAYGDGPSEKLPERWEFVAREAGDLLVVGRTLLDVEREKLLRDTYVEARQRVLELRPPGTFFHARSVRMSSDGAIRLAYDFSEPEQLDDFRPARGHEGALRWIRAKKLLHLRGEARLLDRNPFAGWLGIKGVVSGYDAAAPNVNVALWTHPDDVATLRPDAIDLRGWRDPTGPAPGDYFVFGVGYLLKVDLSAFGGGFGRFARNFESFLPTYLRQPSYVILGVARGKSLHATPRELIFDEAVGRPLSGPIRFSVEMKGSEVRWSVNGRAVPFNSSREVSRLRTTYPRSGSLNLFANGHEVYYSSLEVWGQLEPGWLRERARDLVTEELMRLTRSPDPGARDTGSSEAAAPAETRTGA